MKYFRKYVQIKISFIYKSGSHFEQIYNYNSVAMNREIICILVQQIKLEPILCERTAVPYLPSVTS